MAVEIIDLTSSSPPPVVVDVVEETTVTTEKKKRKKRTRGEAKEQTERWPHDKYTDDHRGEKRKRDKRDDDSRQHKKQDRSPSPIFTVDTTPGDVARDFIPNALAVVDAVPPAEVEQSSADNSLLLPAHVTLAEEFESAPDDNRPLSPVSEASGIDFVDDDRAAGASRYFDDRTSKPKTRGPCKRCGDSDHDFKQCTAMICLTCGARDEHNPRSCPILRFCWNCKGKGHIARNCPRIGDMEPDQLNREDCERCGSWKHHGTNCPTIWRIYTYLTDAERDAVLADRESKRQLGFDNGGEGYIARDAWCYNCGNSGHLGDDCEVADPNYDKPNDYSAFGSYNQLTGPFASPSSLVPDVNRAPREWELDDKFDDGYGFSAQTNVGKRGRENAKAKAREAQRLLDEADDEPDWFNKNQAASKGNGKPPPTGPRDRGGLPQRPAAPTIRMGFQKSSSSRAPWDASPASSTLPARPSLRDRIDVREERGSGKSRSSRDERRSKDSRRNGGDERHRSNDQRRGDDRGRDRETDRYEGHREHKREPDRGSRWRGGYDR